VTVKITTPNGGADSLDFGCAQTAIVATVTGTEVSSGEGKLEFKTTTGGTSAVKATILGNGNFGIGIAPTVDLHVASGADGVAARFQRTSGGGLVDIENYNAIGGIGTADNIPFRINTNNTERLRITADGLGRSQFTAKGWINFDGTGTIAINDSHNITSITDNGTGDYTVTIAVDMGSANYAITATTRQESANLGGTGYPVGGQSGVLVGSFRMFYYNSATDGSARDHEFVTNVVFGD